MGTSIGSHVAGCAPQRLTGNSLMRQKTSVTRQLWPRSPQTCWRRLSAMLTLVGYIFAATFGAVAHSQAMPLMSAETPASETSRSHSGSSHAGHDHNGAETRDHVGMQAPGMPTLDDTPSPQPIKAPCDFSCILCKTCSASGMLALPTHSGHYQPLTYAVRYPPPVAALLADHIGALPSEPPRV